MNVILPQTKVLPMYSVQAIFGKGGHFQLEQSAEAARESTRALRERVTQPERALVLAAFAASRAREEALAAQISEELVNTVVTALDREVIDALFGVPVSTTHNVSASFIGVGVAKRFNAIRWTVVERMVWAWILTLPVTALLAYGLVRMSQQWG